jgi:hypothetical protein
MTFNKIIQYRNSQRWPIMQFQKYMWIIKEAIAAYKPDFIIGINF